MRQKRLKTEYLKYALLDKTTQKVEIYRYKKDVSSKMRVSTRTLDRNIPYETEKYKVFPVKEVHI